MFTGGRDAGRVSPEQASRSAACCSASSGGGWEAGFWPAQGAEKAGGLKTEGFRDGPATQQATLSGSHGDGLRDPASGKRLQMERKPVSERAQTWGSCRPRCERRPAGQAGNKRRAATSTLQPPVSTVTTLRTLTKRSPALGSVQLKTQKTLKETEIVIKNNKPEETTRHREATAGMEGGENASAPPGSGNGTPT